MKKKLLYLALFILLVILALPLIFVGPFYLRVQHFEAEPKNGYHADFYVYVSPKAQQLGKEGKPVTFLVQPNNSGKSDNPAFHSSDAWWMTFGRHSIADDLGVVLLVPAFLRPNEDWHIYTHALDRDVFTTKRSDVARPDLQLLAMIEKAKKSLNAESISTNEKFLIQGYSASGMFANRFTLLHPEKVLAVGAGSPGGWAIAPIKQYKNSDLVYPAGVADLEKLSGSAFDLKAYRNIPQLIVMGDLDINDSLDFTDGWEKDSAALVKKLFGKTPISRWEGSKKTYKLSGANAKFILVENVGHDRKQLQHLTTEFFRDRLEK